MKVFFFTAYFCETDTHKTKLMPIQNKHAICASTGQNILFYFLLLKSSKQKIAF